MTMCYQMTKRTVRAVRFTGSNGLECLAFIHPGKSLQVLLLEDANVPMVETVDGYMTVQRGQWIVRLPDGMCTILADDTFRQLFTETAG